MPSAVSCAEYTGPRLRRQPRTGVGPLSCAPGLLQETVAGLATVGRSPFGPEVPIGVGTHRCGRGSAALKTSTLKHP